MLSELANELMEGHKLETVGVRNAFAHVVSALDLVLEIAHDEFEEDGSFVENGLIVIVFIEIKHGVLVIIFIIRVIVLSFLNVDKFLDA